MSGGSERWERFGQALALAVGEGPDPSCRQAQRVAVRALADLPARRRWPWVLGVAASLAAAVPLLYALIPSAGGPDKLAFWIGDSNAAGREGGWIYAPDSAPVAVRFADGSQIRVERAGRMQVVRADREHVAVVLQEGIVLTVVQPGGGARWSLNAGPFRVEVVGTEFSVSWNGAERNLVVDVRHGKVHLSGPVLPAQGLLLRAEDRLRVSEVGAWYRVEHAPAASGEGPTPGKALAPPAPAVEAIPAPAPPAPPVPPPSDDAPTKDRVAMPPRSPALPPSVPPTPPGWRQLAGSGRYADALAEAEATGFAQFLQQLPLRELMELADTARYARNAARASEALRAVRDRFPGSSSAGMAAFLLGRVAQDLAGDTAAAAEWFATYLAEEPSGPLVEETLGRLMDSLRRAGRSVEAARAADRYLRTYPDGGFAPLARSLLPR